MGCFISWAGWYQISLHYLKVVCFRNISFNSSMLWQLVWVTETMESKIIHECVDHVLCCSKEVARLNSKSRVREYILPSLKGVLSNTLARVGGSQEEDGIAVNPGFTQQFKCAWDVA